jgi:hypothetical protein
MKKISVVLTTMLAASSVYAASASVCSAPTTAGDGTAITGLIGFTAAASGTTGFVLNSFTPKCSANVFAAVEQSEIALAVAAGSKKGKNMFSGSTNGGGVKPTGTLYNNGVATGDTTGEATTALGAASGGST